MKWERCTLLVATFVAALHAAPPASRNTAPGVGYVGSEACASCHRQIYNKYVKTAMGRSITVPASGLIQSALTIHSDTLHRDFEVSREDGDLYQTESSRRDGRTIFESKHKLAYTIGSGENGLSFVVRHGNYLFQAPLSYYAKAHAWDLSPGFEQSDQGFSRPIYDACIACHAGRPRVVPHREGLYLDPPFDEMAIGCENCHGPGQLHIAEKRRGLAQIPDTSIVNPARLPARLAEDICMKCHQGGNARVLLPGKTYNDFRPGIPLLKTVAVVSLPLSAARPDLLEHHVSMKLSKCFRASGGKLSCLTCHNPHVQPDSVSAPAYYRARCLTCHSESSCRVTLTARQEQTPADNCIGCHMPKRQDARISHSALTDHRILAKTDEAVPLQLTDATVKGLPGLLLLDAHAGEPPLPLVTRIAIYGELMDRDPSFRPRYLELLDQAAVSDADDPLVLAALGRRALLQMSAQAVGYLSRAVAKGVPSAATFIDLSKALNQAGRPADATAALERGASQFPYAKDIRKFLILSYIQAKEYKKAEPEMEHYVADFPEDDFMRGLFERVRPSVHKQ
ncbi:MAG TPA: hypothetical protein VN633_17335 [Bryobacteraceae bacterium]|nr:hypothetical protein [Bryobacteraceae bacterium]